MPKAILPQSELKELFDYDPETGVLTWRARPREDFKNLQTFGAWNTRFAGKTAGYLNEIGYLVVTINGKKFQAHRIIYKIIHGAEPPEIDHINGIRDCNLASNLRAATQIMNQRNRKMPTNNTSDVMGVNWNKAKSKWQSQIGVDGKKIHLGYFCDIKDASEARKSAEIEYGFHQNHGRDDDQ